MGETNNNEFVVGPQLEFPDVDVKELDNDVVMADLHSQVSLGLRPEEATKAHFFAIETHM